MSPSGVDTTVSTLSRVVPGMSWTTERSSPMSRLNKVDFPTFGRPTIATAGTNGAYGRVTIGIHIQVVTGRNAATIASSMSPVPRPWIARTGTGSPRPRRAEGPGVGFAAVTVHLVGDDHRVLAGAPQHRRHLCVLFGDPYARVDYQQHHCRITDRLLGLGGDRLSEIVTGRQPAAGVDDGEVPARPIRRRGTCGPG